MAKSSKKKTRYSTKGIGKYQVVMTDRIRLLLVACFLLGFLAVAYIALQM